MNKREDKFKFVTIDEVASNDDIIDNIEIVDTPEEVIVDKVEEVEKKPIEISEGVIDNDISNKKYVGFGTRIFIMVVIVFALLSGAALLIYETIQHSIDNNVTYDESAKVSYQVCLKGEDSGCLDEDNTYNSSNIKSLNVTFDYNIDFSKSVPYELTYHISSITSIYDKNDKSKVLYKDEQLLVDKTVIKDNKNGLGVYKDITYDYLKDNRYVIDYKDVYNKDYVADVKIALYLDEGDESKEVAYVLADLNSNSFEINKYNTINNNQQAQISSMSWNKYTIMFAVMASLLIILALVLIFRITRLVLKVTNNRTRYQQKLVQILRDYDRIIVIARDGYETNKDREIIKLNSFDKLLDIKDNLNKPIIFSKVSEVKSEFIVEDEDKLYKFVLKDEDV